MCQSIDYTLFMITFFVYIRKIKLKLTCCSFINGEIQLDVERVCKLKILQ